MLLTNEQREQLSQIFSSNCNWLIRTNKSDKNIETSYKLGAMALW